MQHGRRPEAVHPGPHPVSVSAFCLGVHFHENGVHQLLQNQEAILATPECGLKSELGHAIFLEVPQLADGRQTEQLSPGFLPDGRHRSMQEPPEIRRILPDSREGVEANFSASQLYEQATGHRLLLQA